MSESKKGNSITREEFNSILNEAKLSKKDFATMLKTSYNTVNAWGSNNREIPYWVRSWMRLYVCCNNGIKLRDLLREHVCNEKNSDFAKFSIPLTKS